MTIPYRFAAWSRRGLARAHTNPDTASGPLAVRPRITVGLTLQAKSNGNTATAATERPPAKSLRACWTV